MKKGSLKCGGIFDLEVKEDQVKELELQMAESNFWDNAVAAQKVIEELNGIRAWTTPMKEIASTASNFKEMYPEAESIDDAELMKELSDALEAADKKLSELEVRQMLRDEHDLNDCYLEINAGAGGTESCDWAAMLSRMYQRWASKKGWKVEVVDMNEGDVAGIKKVTYRFSGPYAYGYSKAERGVHRLVRISPFDANAKRHTSFASVGVFPIVDDVQVEVRTEDLKVDTYRASGAGGQHVNKTDSAVRITHLPTGIVVSCQGERSQVQNKETCMKMLKSKLYEKERSEQQEKISALGGEKTEIGWGHQIRNYVFQPYTLVKDARTDFQTSNVQAVMDGEIDDFIVAYLKGSS